MKYIKRVIDSIIVSTLELVAIIIFLLPIYYTIKQENLSNLLYCLISWLPALFLLAVAETIGSIEEDKKNNN